MPLQYNCYQCGKIVQIGKDIKKEHFTISSVDTPIHSAPNFKDVRFCSRRCVGDFGNFKPYKFADKTKEV